MQTATQGNDYIEKLKDPRWQKKRLEIFTRDDWTCQRCYDTEATLNAHHKRYIPNLEPWDYPNTALITLCESCHKLEKAKIGGSISNLVEQVREKFLSNEIDELAKGFNALDCLHIAEVVAGTYSWALSEPQIQTKLLDSYFNYLHEKLRKDPNAIRRIREITNG